MTTVMQQTIQAIIFDCDGTLVDTEPIATRIFLSILKDLGLTISAASYADQFVGTSMHAILDYVEHTLGKELDRANISKRYRQESAAAYEQGLPPIQGMPALLDRLAVEYAVASNGPLSKMELTLPAAGYASLIDRQHIYSAYEVNKWKPDPTLFLHAAARLGVDPRHCLVVEDTIHGIEAAIAAGMHIVAVNVKHHIQSVQDLCVPIVRDGVELASYLRETYGATIYK